MMRFTIDANVLAQAMAKVALVAGRDNGSKCILGNALILADHETQQVTLSSSDPEHQIDVIVRH